MGCARGIAEQGARRGNRRSTMEDRDMDGGGSHERNGCGDEESILRAGIDCHCICCAGQLWHCLREYDVDGITY